MSETYKFNGSKCWIQNVRIIRISEPLIIVTTYSMHIQKNRANTYLKNNASYSMPIPLLAIWQLYPPSSHCRRSDLMWRVSLQSAAELQWIDFTRALAEDVTTVPDLF